MLFSKAGTHWPSAMAPRKGDVCEYASSPYFSSGGFESLPGF